MMDEPITRKSQECCPFFLSYFSKNSILRWKKDRKKGVEIGGVVLLKRRSLTPSHSVQSSLSRVSHTMTHTHTKKNWKQVFLLLYYIHTRNSIHNFIFCCLRGTLSVLPKILQWSMRRLKTKLNCLELCQRPPQGAKRWSANLFILEHWKLIRCRLRLLESM